MSGFNEILQDGLNNAFSSTNSMIDRLKALASADSMTFTGPVKNKFLQNTEDGSKRSVGIIGCPFSGGQGRTGVDDAPTHLVNHGLIEQLQGLGWDVTFDGHQQFSHLQPSQGEDPPIGKMKNPRYVSRVSRSVKEVVSSHLEKKQLALTLGGDHSLGIGTVAGVLEAYPDACVLWIDAHADVNTPESTDTGNLHGCPLSFLLGLAETHDEFKWIPKCLDPSRLAYIGLRDVDPAEKEIIRKHNIAAYSMHHVDKYGIGAVVQMALNRVNPGLTRPIHLSFDVDSMDPTVAPSTGTPVRGGLTWREGMFICEAVHETGCLVAMDIMEVNPSLQDEVAVELTVKSGCALARCALGETLL